MLNFGGSLFPERVSQIRSFDFADLLRGNVYVNFYAGKVNQPEVNDEIYEGAADGYSQNGWYGQTFTIGDLNSRSKFFMKAFQINTGGKGELSSTFKIQKCNGAGLPDGTDIWSGNGTRAVGWYEIDLGKRIELTGGQKYAILANLAKSLPNYTNWNSDGSSPTYTGGNRMTSADGTTWIADTTTDFLFRITGYAVNPYTLFTKEFTSDTESETTMNNLNFEVEINKTSEIEGFALINVNTNGQTDIKAEIFHIRNSVETSLGNNVTSVDTTRKAIGITLTKQKFLKGDKLKLALSSATGTFNIDYSDSTGAKTLIVYIPFNVEEF